MISISTPITTCDIPGGRQQWAIVCSDVREGLRQLPAGSVHTIVTSPPYWGLRAYGTSPQVWADGWRGELGAEPDPLCHVTHMVEVGRELWRVLRPDGTLWLVMGSGSYAGSGRGPTGHNGIGDQERRQGFVGSRGARIGSVHGESGHTSGVTPPNGFKPKDLIMTPFFVAEALRADGWWLRQLNIWEKPACMPESVRDRGTTSHEYILMLSKGRHYFYDQEAIREPGGGNRRSVWRVPSETVHGAHSAAYPTQLVEPMILAGSSSYGCCVACSAPWKRTAQSPDTVTWKASCRCGIPDVAPAIVLDPFCGTASTGVEALRHGRRFIGIELNPAYVTLGTTRIEADCPMFNGQPGGPQAID